MFSSSGGSGYGARVTGRVHDEFLEGFSPRPEREAP
jgi:hypothetical protein